jgi:putative ABC transport system permease protein
VADCPHREWKTIVTSSSIVIAFGVSVAVGVIFGIYPR